MSITLRTHQKEEGIAMLGKGPPSLAPLVRIMFGNLMPSMSILIFRCASQAVILCQPRVPS